MTITSFEEIESWQMARKLTNSVYEITNEHLFSKDFGLKDQIRRASGSIMHNIAEGFDAGSNREFFRFLHYSKRSATEVQSELYLALDQNYIDQSKFEELYKQAKQIRKKIAGFIKYLKQYEQK